MDIGKLALAALGLYIGYKVAVYIGGWLVDWARNAIRAFVGYVSRGLLLLARSYGAIKAHAMGVSGGRSQLVETIEVDESDLPPEVVDALYRSGAVYQNVDV